MLNHTFAGSEASLRCGEERAVESLSKRFNEGEIQSVIGAGFSCACAKDPKVGRVLWVGKTGFGIK